MATRYRGNRHSRGDYGDLGAGISTSGYLSLFPIIWLDTTKQTNPSFI